MAKTSVADLLRRAFRARDQAELQEIEKEIPPEEGERGDLTGDPTATGGELRDDHIHIHLPQRRDETMAKEESSADRRDDRRPNFGSRRRFTDPGEDPGADPGEMGGGDLDDILQEILARLEALEDQLGAGHGGSTDRGRDDRRRDGWHYFSRRGRDRSRGRDDDDCRDDARDEDTEGTGMAGPKTISKEEAEGEHEIPGDLEMKAPTGTTSDRARRARDNQVRDSSEYASSFRDVAAAAEILVPGIRLPTFDQKAPAQTTVDCMCQLQRDALELARNTPELRREIEELAGNQPISKLTADELKTVFRAAALYRGRQNNAGLPRQRDWMAESGFGGGTGVHGRIKNPGDLNSINREYYARQRGAQQ